jgi:hypothetical protein
METVAGCGATGSTNARQATRGQKGGKRSMITTTMIFHAMGNKKKSKKSKKRVSFRHVWEAYLKPSNIDAQVTKKHMQETERHLTRWETFWAKSKEPRIPGCSRDHLVQWRRDLLGGGKFNARTINKHLGTIRSIMVAADKNGLMKFRPKLEQLPSISTDEVRKIYLKDEQIDRLMESADSLTWPPREITGLEPAQWWRCALVLYRTYGFRTQELLAYEAGKKSLTWWNIALGVESPNPASDLQNEHGWLFYVPPKTQRKKPTPIYLPLTCFTRAAIDILKTGKDVDVFHALFPMPRSQERFMAEWNRWFDVAGVKPKVPGARFKPYCLRKTCATHLSQHYRGLATAVCRWGSDGNEAKVATDHYISDDLLLQQLLTAPMPKSFEMLLSVKPIEQGDQS